MIKSPVVAFSEMEQFNVLLLYQRNYTFSGLRGQEGFIANRPSDNRRESEGIILHLVLKRLWLSLKSHVSTGSPLKIQTALVNRLFLQVVAQDDLLAI